MKSSITEEILDSASYKVVWGDYEPKYEFLAAYCPGTMLDSEWDALEMMQYDLMAIGMRSKYGFNELPE